MTAVQLDDIRNSLEGAVPSTIVTCSPEGVPNITYTSQVHYVDDCHVALSFQFFNKTRRNVLASRRATVRVMDPDTAVQHMLRLSYLRTETEGPLFESMKARLAGIASHEGMSAVFRLLGSDVYRVESIEAVPGKAPCPPPKRFNRLAALRVLSTRLAGSTDLESLCAALMDGIREQLAVTHARLLMPAADGQRLYTLASVGYEESAVGSELRIGEGVIGTAAQQRVPIRITFMAPEYLYTRATRDRYAADPEGAPLGPEIPFHGLAEARSQLAVPICAGAQLVGVLYVESPESRRFGHEDEDALVTLAAQLGPSIQALQCAVEGADEPAATAATQAEPQGAAAEVRHYGADDSLFVDGDYLIKGVAGAIAWKLLREHAAGRRRDFTNRELRLDPDIRLPELSENLEARLILLRRRLVERCPFIRMQKTGRGRFRLEVERPLRLEHVQ
ncbi:MAG: GAF domain-containing protein [Gammaproteobacteria bacterium]|nr:GAF domain-containing protein [Gammaproteobacteria bacterium]